MKKLHDYCQFLLVSSKNTLGCEERAAVFFESRYCFNKTIFKITE